MISNNFKVYSLVEPNSDVVRYIGCTRRTPEKRLERHLNQPYKSPKNDWIKSLKLQGLRPEMNVIVDGLTEEEAYLMEKEYIKLFKSVGARLTNVTTGGKGTSGFKVSEEYKNRLRSEKKGIPLPRKMIEAAAIAKHNPVNQYSLDGVFIKRWDAIKFAAQAVGAFHNNISHCCQGKIKTCKGFIWKYADQSTNLN